MRHVAHREASVFTLPTSCCLLQLRHKRNYRGNKEQRSFQSWPRSQNATLVAATGADANRDSRTADSNHEGNQPPQDTGESTKPGAAVASSLDSSADTACQGMLLRREQRVFVPRAARAVTSATEKETGRPHVKQRRPPILWTFPGSGNTWCRMLLEQATGWLTGSVYNDPSLKRIFKAEGMHGRRDLVAIKVHPNVKGYDAERVQNTFGATTPMILVVRDPFRAIWSEGQRRITRSLRHIHNFLGKGGIHTLSLTRNWLSNKNNWGKWVQLAKRMATDYHAMWMHYDTLIQRGAPHVFIPYEDLTDETRRHGALDDMLQFIGHGFDQKRVQCAFDSAENKAIRRPSAGSSANARALFNDAYPSDDPFTCEIWRILLPAQQIAVKLGYAWQYKSHVQCDSVLTASPATPV